MITAKPNCYASLAQLNPKPMSLSCHLVAECSYYKWLCSFFLGSLLLILNMFVVEVIILTFKACIYCHINYVMY